ncbi:MAG: hypothetical protein Kow00124_19640 [Anaerolineae bacterium]
MRIHRGELIWGGLLILAGTLFLLNTLGILSFNIWTLIWPLFLIGAGLSILLAHRVTEGETERLMLPLEGAESAQIHIEGMAGELRLGAGREERADALMTGDFVGGVEFSTRREGGVLRVRMSSRAWFGSGRWDVGVKRGVPLEIKLDGAAGPAWLDLTDLHVTRFKADGRLGALHVRMPARVPFTTAKIDGSVGDITVEIPQGVAASITVDQGLGKVTVNPERFPMVGDKQYRSPDYETAPYRLELKIDAAVGMVSVR